MPQGFAEKGGARQEDAWELWAKAGLDDGFQHAWLLSDVNQDGFLSEQARTGYCGVLIDDFACGSLAGLELRERRA